MSMVFAVEEVTIDINVKENGDEAADDLASADDAQELEAADDEVEAIIRKGEQIDAVLTNMNLAYAHIRTFGVTKPALHLLNRKGALAGLIGQSLPTMESDDLPEDVDFDPADVDVEMALESIGDRLKSIVDAIKAFFKRIYDAVAQFFTKYFGAVQRLRKRLEAHKKTTIKNVSKADIKFADIKTKTWTKKDLDDLVTAADAAIKEITAKVDFGEVAVAPSDDLKMTASIAFLKAMGIVVEAEEDTDEKDKPKFTFTVKADTGDAKEKEDGTMSELGYSVANTATAMYQGFYDLTTSLLKQNKLLSDIDKAAKKAVKTAQDELKTDEDANNISAATYKLAESRKRTTARIQIAKEVCKKAIVLVSAYVAILDKIKIKS